MVRRLVRTPGFFLDIGSGPPQKTNNTYMLERIGWSGIMMDRKIEMIEETKLCRKATAFCMDCAQGRNEWLQCRIAKRNEKWLLSMDMIENKPKPISMVSLPNTRKPTMLIGLPNSGTDWLADNISANNQELKYYREYFNPISNYLCPMKVATMFGCELSSKSLNIAKIRPWEEYNFLLNETWRLSEFNFTKENYSAFHMPNHCKVFRCFVLYRELKYCMPCLSKNAYRRTACKTWYDAIYFSLISNKNSLDPEIIPFVEYAQSNADTLEKQQVSAHLISYYKVLKEARIHQIPVLDYNVLTSSDRESIVSHLVQISWLGNIESLTDRIIETRITREDASSFLKCDDYIESLTELMK